MLEVWLRKICHLAFGVEDDRKEVFEQYKEYEIYLTPRQEGVYDVGIYKKGRLVNQVRDIHLSVDEIVGFAKEWIEENEKYT